MRTLLVSGVLALAACGSADGDAGRLDRDEVLLQVLATGRADTRPDEARMLLGVQTIAPTSGAASRENARKMNAVTAALAALGVKPDDIQTRALTLRRIDYGPERGRFEANNQAEVRLRNLARAGEAVAVATEAGANVLSGPNLAIADPEAAGRSAYAAAFRAARARAETYAEAAGLRVAGVLTIRDAGDGGIPPEPYYGRGVEAPQEAMAVVAPQAAPPPPSPGISPGVTTRQVSVRVDFALADGR